MTDKERIKQFIINDVWVTIDTDRREVVDISNKYYANNFKGNKFLNELATQFAKFKAENEQLQQQLKINDQENLELENQLYVKEVLINILNSPTREKQVKLITKQVCDNIRKYCQTKIIPTSNGIGYCEEEYNKDTGFNEALFMVIKYLDQVEKGDKQ